MSMFLLFQFFIRIPANVPSWACRWALHTPFSFFSWTASETRQWYLASRWMTSLLRHFWATISGNATTPTLLNPSKFIWRIRQFESLSTCAQKPWSMMKYVVHTHVGRKNIHALCVCVVYHRCVFFRNPMLLVCYLTYWFKFRIGTSLCDSLWQEGTFKYELVQKVIHCQR